MPTPFPPPDLAGQTHIGRVRSENQDHFLGLALADSVYLRSTSVPDHPEGDWRRIPADAAAGSGSLVLAAVADGVGGGPGGEWASRQTLLGLSTQLAGVLRDPPPSGEIPGRLTTAVLSVHRRLLEIGNGEPSLAGMATTLTAWVGVGGDAFVIQVGDSRCYRLRDGVLELLTRDQTMAQDLVDQGLIDDLSQAPLGWDNILTGALGGSSAEPAIHVTDRRPGDVVLVCSDGVMKHLSDDQIARVLAQPSDSETTAREIVQRALDDGGSDNITCVVLRETP